MGCGMSQEEKAAKQRRLVVEASEPLQLISTSPAFELPAYQAQTVLEVLEIRTKQIGLPKTAAAWLNMEFSDAIISHEKTLKEAGLCDQAEIRVQGEDEAKKAQTEQVAKAKLKEQAAKVDIHEAAKGGKADEVQLVSAFYPERVHARDSVTAWQPSRCC